MFGPKSKYYLEMPQSQTVNHPTALYNRARNTVGNKSYCRSRGRQFDPGVVPYFHGD